MGLLDIVIHRTSVEYREQTIEVRGLSTNDLMLAAQDYGPQMVLLFGKITSGEMQTSDIKTALVSVAREMPEVAGAAIALASDSYSPEAVKKATQLPFPVQAQLVEAIFNETFYSEAEVKKLIESLMKMITAVSGVLEKVNPSPLQTGTGDFDGGPTS